jgi:cell wall-associated NlpC family hydrolase
VTLDGVAAVQARIAQIQQLASSTVAATGLGAATSAPASAPGQSQEFASLLADAMAGGTTTSDPLSNTPAGAGGSGSIGGSSMISQLMQLSQLTGAASGSPATGAIGTSSGAIGTSSAGNAIAQTFVNNALQEKGKPYVYGANAAISDPNPKAFDCSELTKWASARAGITIPDGATAQYLYIREHGGTMSVQQALHTPGALLFHFGHEPKNLGDIPADGHVAISLGDGVHTIEARGHAYGTNVFDNAAGRSFNYAGMIPGMA